MTISEMKYALHQTANCLFPTVVSLFFHSFSLLDWVNEPDNPIVKSKKIKKLEAAIRYIAASDSFAFISELELNDIETVNRKDAMNSKIVWNSNIKGMWYTYLTTLATHIRCARLGMEGSGRIWHGAVFAGGAGRSLRKWSGERSKVDAARVCVNA